MAKLCRRPTPKQLYSHFTKACYGWSYEHGSILQHSSFLSHHMSTCKVINRSYTVAGVFHSNIVQKHTYSTCPLACQRAASRNSCSHPGYIDSRGLNHLNPLLVSDSLLSQQLRFASSHQRQRDRKFLGGNKESNGFSKNSRNSRRSSEHSTSKSKSKDNQSPATSPQSDVKEEIEGKTNGDVIPPGNMDGAEQLTLRQRFTKTYKEHGKVLVAVHVATSLVWFGSFYTAASFGFDIVPLLESWNFSDRIISPFRSGSLGNVALAYLLYKLATPARYTVTLGGTNLAIKYLQKEGKMKTVPKQDSLRSLYKEGKDNLKDHSKKRIQRLNRRARRVRKKDK